MTRLCELSTMKTEIMTRIISNKNLCKALYYNDPDFLDKIEINDPYSLLYDRVFPYRRVPEVEDEAKTFINLSLSRFRKIDNSFKDGLITIFVITHTDLVRTDYGILRYDYIINEIDELFNQKRGLGIGKLEFAGMDELYVNKKFIGISVSYKPVDFN
ncbi:hypothetical protein [Paenibacillus sp. NAIST15-1]|uniref:hypothetical protein n=1 Tax=Paenibacillus sp. NAIST15-1 TaxID=1605994 RepID=UPI00086CD470|nr:hypothetical protein [Paenibacillus sp. NAIST15-1]GAV11289.1 hypothetical protein PBN151_1216 [Paenibacillus sp. NAIST15-1]